MIDDKKIAEQGKPASQGSRAEMPANGTTNAFLSVGQRYVHAMAALNETVMQIGNEHMRANVDAAKTLGRCHSFDEAMEVHSNLIKASSTAYMRGWTQLMERSSQLVADNLDQFRKPH